MTAVMSARLNAVEWEMPAAIGTKATTVPTLVPMDTEMKQAARNNPGNSRLAGSSCSARLTVASMAPICLAEEAKAPAST